MNDSIPTRYQLRVKQRRRLVQYAEEHGLRAASRHSDRRVERYGHGFGAGRPAVKLACRSIVSGERVVSDAICELARVARLEYRWGSTRTRIWLERVHQIRVNAKTIQRIFRSGRSGRDCRPRGGG